MAKILIVDDRPSNRELLVTLLKYQGHQLFEAADGHEALSLARRETPDLVIADILMPTMDGYEFVRRLRLDDTIASTRVIFFTAHYREEAARKLGRACGVSIVLTKPAEPTQILESVETALGAKSHHIPPPPAAEFDREHLRLLTDTLTDKVSELRRTNARLSALIDLGLHLGAELDPRRLMYSFTQSAREIVGARYAVTGILNGRGEAVVRYVFTSGMDAELASRLGSLDPRKMPSVKQVLDSGRPIRFENADGDPVAIGLSPTHPPVHALLGVPITSPSRTYGWLGLIDKLGEKGFSEEDERLAASLAAQIGRVYQNGSLYAEALEHAGELERDIYERKRAEAVLSESETRMRRAIELAPLPIMLHAEDGTILQISRAWTEISGYSQEDLPTVQAWIEKAHGDHGAEVRRIVKELYSIGPGPTDDGEFVIRTRAGEKRVWSFRSALLDGYSAGKRLVVSTATDITDRKHAEEALAERVRQASLVAQVGRALTRGNTLQEMLQLCADAFIKHLNLAVISIWTHDENRGELELRVEVGAGASLPSDARRVKVGSSRIGMIARDRAPLISNELSGDARIGVEDWARREGMVSFAGYPLLIGERLIGVVGTFSRQTLTASTLDALGSVADEIALGIERKLAVQALRESEEHTHLLLDSTAEAIYGVDPHGHCTFANRSCARVLGYSRPSDFLGQHMHSLIHHTRPDGSPYPAADCPIIQGFAHGRESHIAEDVFWRADGSSIPVECWAYPIRREGEIVGSVVTFIDISERKRLEARYRETEHRLEQVLASSPSIIYTLRIEDGRMTGIDWMSDNVKEVLGYTPEQTQGKHWWLENVHPEHRERIIKQTLEDLADRGKSSSEYRFRHSDGKYLWIRSELRVVRNAEGGWRLVVGSWSDVTERKQLEEQFRQSQKMEAVGRLAGGVAHDFNNLLTVINGYGELLLSTLPPSDFSADMIREIVAAGNRAAGLTRQLLAFSRKAILEPKPLHLETVVLELEKMLRRIVGEDIQLAITTDRDAGTVLADPGQIEQVILNLVVNARDAMPRGGRLTIEVHTTTLDESYTRDHPDARPGSYVLLAVSDTGSGMDEATRARVFEPFFTTKGEHGTGLGLATVHGIIKQSDGHIAVYSELGFGTTFKVYLPRLDRPAEAPKSKPNAAEFPRGTETILVVEDEDGVRALIQHLLERCGYAVVPARDGFEALEIAEQLGSEIHLLMTDVVMPRMSGRDLGERLSKQFPGMRVLFLSGYTDDAIVRHGILESEVAFLHKPFTPGGLAEKVRQVLDAG
jgi:PAS domain S-box-containing protein